METQADAARGGADVVEEAEVEPDLKDIVFGDVPPVPGYAGEPNRKQASLQEWEDIVNSEETEKFLLEGKVLWGRTRAKVKTLHRLGEDARRVLFLCEITNGEINFKAQLKVSQQNYHEWKSEINAYKIGKRIGLVLPPVVLRCFPRTSFNRLGKPLSKEDIDLIYWSGKTSGSARGSLRYWVESLNSRTIGGKVADKDYLFEIAQALHPGNREELDKYYPVYLEMGRAFLFDYLTYNNDRARNMGTLVLPDGSEKLILIDQGLAFGVEGKKKKSSFLFFNTMKMLPSDVIDHLKTLTEGELDQIVGSGSQKKVELSPKVISQIWERRGRIIEKAEELEGLYGHLALY